MLSPLEKRNANALDEKPSQRHSDGEARATLDFWLAVRSRVVRMSNRCRRAVHRGDQPSQAFVIARTGLQQRIRIGNQRDVSVLHGAQRAPRLFMLDGGESDEGIDDDYIRLGFEQR